MSCAVSVTSCATYPSRSPASNSPTGSPNSFTVPVSGSRVPSIISRSVLLPLPLGPTNPRNAPGSMSMDTASKTVTSPNAKEPFCTLTTGVVTPSGRIAVVVIGIRRERQTHPRAQSATSSSDMGQRHPGDRAYTSASRLAQRRAPVVTPGACQTVPVQLNRSTSVRNPYSFCVQGFLQRLQVDLLHDINVAPTVVGPFLGLSRNRR